MTERALRGTAASPGVGVGAIRRLAVRIEAGEPVAAQSRPAEIERARSALAAAAEQLDAVAERLRADGRDEEAEIVATGALMARDPGLAAAIDAAVADGLAAPAAILAGCRAQADALAAIPDETLAARADDVRSVGRRAARLAADGDTGPPAAGDTVLVADDLGPADVAELQAGVQAVALAGGGATAHAAIVARSLGVPMVAGLGPTALELAEGELAVVDGGAGTLLVGAGVETLDAARAAARSRHAARGRAAARRNVPAETTDGRRIAVLANVSGPAELRIALGAGAEGVGLLRTELAFLQSRTWPTEGQHRRALEPVLRRLGGRPATVRVLDFGGDKLPPCAGAAQERGIALLLRHPEALDAQLRAILRAAGDADVRVLVPLVESPGQLDACTAALRRAAEAVGLPLPALGPMVETPRATAAAPALARRADFLSIGTNDLTAATLGFDRFADSGGPAHHPCVLREVARTIEAAHEARIAVEVCGEAAGDPIALPLLVGLGVDELSVGASRVGIVREWVRALSRAEAAELADQALKCAGADEVELLVTPLVRRLEAVERGDAQAVAVAPGH
jgi:phosphoenolpyruvate-protein kinase (PTS system EI component)